MASNDNVSVSSSEEDCRTVDVERDDRWKDILTMHDGEAFPTVLAKVEDIYGSYEVFVSSKSDELNKFATLREFGENKAFLLKNEQLISPHTVLFLIRKLVDQYLSLGYAFGDAALARSAVTRNYYKQITIIETFIDQLNKCAWQTKAECVRLLFGELQKSKKKADLFEARVTDVMEDNLFTNNEPILKHLFMVTREAERQKKEQTEEGGSVAATPTAHDEKKNVEVKVDEEGTTNGGGGGQGKKKRRNRKKRKGKKEVDSDDEAAWPKNSQEASNAIGAALQADGDKKSDQIKDMMENGAEIPSDMLDRTMAVTAFQKEYKKELETYSKMSDLKKNKEFLLANEGIIHRGTIWYLSALVENEYTVTGKVVTPPYPKVYNYLRQLMCIQAVLDYCRDTGRTKAQCIRRFFRELEKQPRELVRLEREVWMAHEGLKKRYHDPFWGKMAVAGHKEQEMMQEMQERWQGIKEGMGEAAQACTQQ